MLYPDNQGFIVGFSIIPAGSVATTLTGGDFFAHGRAWLSALQSGGRTGTATLTSPKPP